MSFTLADFPGTPTPAPSADVTNTNTTQIALSFSNTNTDVGGSPVTSLELQRDDGMYNDFYTILESTNEVSYIDTNVTRGSTYRYRYRVKNSRGWSAYSAVSYL